MTTSDNILTRGSTELMPDSIRFLSNLYREKNKNRARQIKKVNGETWPTTTPCTVRGEHDIVMSDTSLPWQAIFHHVALHVELPTLHVTIQITRFKCILQLP